MWLVSVTLQIWIQIEKRMRSGTDIHHPVRLCSRKKDLLQFPHSLKFEKSISDFPFFLHNPTILMVICLKLLIILCLASDT